MRTLMTRIDGRGYMIQPWISVVHGWEVVGVESASGAVVVDTEHGCYIQPLLVLRAENPRCECSTLSDNDDPTSRAKENRLHAARDASSSVGIWFTETPSVKLRVLYLSQRRRGARGGDGT